MSYQRSDYGLNPHAGKARNNAQARGWGPGWPNCQTHLWVVVAKAGVRVPMRREIAPLVATLFEVTEAHGYDIRAAGDGPCGGTWGASCRNIRGTDTPSNHSYGLAPDLNAPCNPQSTRFVCDIPPKVVAEWEACNFYWGGRYTSLFDPMHMEYLGTPQTVATDLARARARLAQLGGGGSSTQEDVVRLGRDEGELGKQFQRMLNAFMDATVEHRNWKLPAGMKVLVVDGVLGSKTREMYQHAIERARQILDQPSMIGGHLDTVGPIPLQQIGEAYKEITRDHPFRNQLSDEIAEVAKSSGGGSGAGGVTVDQVLDQVRVEATLRRA